MLLFQEWLITRATTLRHANPPKQVAGDESEPDDFPPVAVAGPPSLHMLESQAQQLYVEVVLDEPCLQFFQGIPRVGAYYVAAIQVVMA